MMTIVVKNLSKRYGATRAVDDVSLTIAPNKIHGLLGRNGAGKTTLLNLITRKIFPDSGEISIAGQNVMANDMILSQVFHVTEKNYYPADYRLKKLLRWCKEFYPQTDLPYAESLAKQFALNLEKTPGGLSTGYASIFKAIMALASGAPVLIFDEPVLGLDAGHRELLYKELIACYSRNPKTIIISTHLIEEVAGILEEAMIIDEGRIVLQRPVEDLLEQSYTVSGEAQKVEAYLAGRPYSGAETMGRHKSAIVLERLAPTAEQDGKELGLEFGRVSLQKLFISLTNSQGVRR